MPADHPTNDLCSYQDNKRPRMEYLIKGNGDAEHFSLYDLDWSFLLLEDVLRKGIKKEAGINPTSL